MEEEEEDEGDVDNLREAVATNEFVLGTEIKKTQSVVELKDKKCEGEYLRDSTGDTFPFFDNLSCST